LAQVSAQAQFVVATVRCGQHLQQPDSVVAAMMVPAETSASTVAPPPPTETVERQHTLERLESLESGGSSRLNQFSAVVGGFQSLAREVTREELVEEGVVQHAADARVVQQNMEQAFMQHFALSIRLFGIMFLLVLLTQSALLLWLAISFMLGSCNGPVRMWAGYLFWITIFNGTINSKQGCQSMVRRLICCFTQDPEESRPVPLRIHLFDILTRFLLPLVWNILGVYWTTMDANAEKPCQVHAPGFLAAARAYSVFTIACSVIALFSIVGMATVLRHAMRHGLLKTSRAADPKVIERCEVITLSSADLQENPSCSICMEEYCGTKPIVKTACGHIFHKQCLKNWLQVDKTCPLCRSDLEAPNAQPV